MSESVEAQSQTPIPVAAPDSWWQTETESSPEELALTLHAHRALRRAGVERIVDLCDLDLEQIARQPGLEHATVEEIARLRDVQRYRIRVPSPNRTLYADSRADGTFPPSWQTAEKEDEIEAFELSGRARSALSTAGVVYVADLLDTTLAEIGVQRGVGPLTLIELEDLFEVLHLRFASVSMPRQDSVDGYFERIWPRPSARRNNLSQAVLLRYLGLHPGRRWPLSPWPIFRAIAADLGVSDSAVFSYVSKARRGWRHPSRVRIRNDLAGLLEDHGGLLTAAGLAERLLDFRGSAAGAAVRRRRAMALVRAGVEGERAGRPTSPRFRANRRAGEVFIRLAGRSADAGPLPG